MSRKDKNGGSNKGEDSTGGGWEVIYSGFILILLCFFIMLSSFSTLEEAKIMRFVRSFVNAVSILPGGVKFESGPAVVAPSPDIVDARSELSQVFGELKALASRFDISDDVDISFSPEGLVMRLADHAIFDVGIAAISPAAMPMLRKVGAIIAKTSYDVRIEGHSDNVPIRTEQFPSNWELSTARAVNVLRYFIETYNIPSKRLSAVGFGEFSPLVPNDSLEHRAKNRRVEIIFLNPAKKSSSAKETG